MLHITDWQRVVSAISLILMTVLVMKLYATGLARHYRYFSFYLLFEVAITTLLMSAKNGSTTYARIWLFSRPGMWVLGLLVLLEIYGLVMVRYPGIASLMRAAVMAAVLLSLVVSLLTLGLDFQNPHEKFPILRCAFAIQRTVDGTMALSLVVPLLFIAQFPVRLCRNVVVHCLLFSTMTGMGAGALFLRNRLGSEYNALTNLAMTCCSILCLTAWVAAIDRRGQIVEQAVGPMASPETEQQLLERLRAFNEILVRSGDWRKAQAL